MNFLTEKLGPLPAWAWGGIVGGGVIAWRLFTKRESNDPVEVPGEDFEIPTQTARAPTSYMPFAAPPDVVALDEAREAAVTEAYEMLDPRIVNLEDLLSETTDSLSDTREELATRTQELAAWQIAVGKWTEATSVLAGAYQGYADYFNDRLGEVNAALATPREINPAPHVAPPPPSPAKPQPVAGSHVWQGATKPNMTSINNLLLNRYGKVVPVRVTRPGSGGYLVTIA